MIIMKIKENGTNTKIKLFYFVFERNGDLLLRMLKYNIALI